MPREAAAGDAPRPAGQFCPGAVGGKDRDRMSAAPVLLGWQGHLVRLAKFGLVGISGLLVNSFLLFLFHGVASLPLLLAAPAAYEFSVVNNYLWNDVWTFGTHSPSLRRLLKFNLISLGALGITVGTLYALVEWAAWHYLLANLAGIGIGFLWNFSMNVLWTWRRAVGRVQGPLARATGR